MADKSESFGMMDGTYFVSKGAILEWINEDFQLQLTKIEQCATGAVYCQIMDKLCPNSFNFKNVKWDAKFDYQYIDNFKVLQNAFKNNNIKKVIEVEKLTKARYQDNLEFCQWIKKYFELHCNTEEPYDAVARRGANAKIHYILGGNKVAPPKKNVYTPDLAARPQTAAVKRPRQSVGGFNNTMTTGMKKELQSAVSTRITRDPIKKDDNKQAKEEIEKLEKSMKAMKANNEVLEKERALYFGKLQQMEEVIQKKGIELSTLGQGLLEILYAGDDDKVEIQQSGDVVIKPHDGEQRVISIDVSRLLTESVIGGSPQSKDFTPMKKGDVVMEKNEDPQKDALPFEPVQVEESLLDKQEVLDQKQEEEEKE